MSMNEPEIGSEDITKNLNQEQAIALVPSSFAWEHDVLPLSMEGDEKLYIGLAQENPEVEYRVKQFSHAEQVITKILTIDQIRNGIKKAYPLHASVSEADVTVIWQSIVDEAVLSRATDIFIEPLNSLGDGRVRFSIDDMLHPPENNARLSPKIFERLVGLIRAQSDVQPQNPNLPADGRMKIEAQGRNNDIRISSIPVGNFQCIAARFLGNSITLRPLQQLGMFPHLFKRFQNGIKRPGAFVTIAGPTGEGKSTTGYSALKGLDIEHGNICTIENPVECEIPGVKQIPIQVEAERASTETQMTFAGAMRALLRQAPNFIFLGEMRDKETVEIAMQASTTGIALLATVHAYDALRTIIRLEGLGANRNEIAQSVTMSMSQRLLRKLCSKCKVRAITMSKISMSIAEKYHISLEQGNIFKASENGCAFCRHTGYYDRVGVFEIIHYSAAIRDALEQGKGINEIAHLAVEEGYRPLAVSGLEHLANGDTSEDEIRRKLSYEDALSAIRPNGIVPLPGSIL